MRHDSERREGRSVACVLAGRRLRWAWSRAQDLLQELTHMMLSLAAIPEADAAMGLPQDAFVVFLSAARGMVHLRVGYLDSLPYVLARLREPGIVARARHA